MNDLSWINKFQCEENGLNGEHTSKEELLQYLDNMDFICNKHFVLEEATMIEEKYPLSDFHEAFHREIKKHIGDLKIRVGANQANKEIVSKICEAGSTILNNHVKNEDTAFNLFCTKKDNVNDSGYLGCILEIVHENNNILGTGIIKSINKDIIVVTNKGQSPIPTKINDEVKFNVFSSKESLRVWKARVISSDITELKVTNVTLVASGNKRNFFRVKTDINARLEIVDEERSMMFWNPLNIGIKVEDLSLGGLLFSSEQVFELDDKIIVEMEILKEKLRLQCLLVRKFQEVGVYKYGCKFVGYSTRQGEMLAKFVVNHQRAMALRGR